MSGFLGFIRNLFSSSSDTSESAGGRRSQPKNGKELITGTDSDQGVASIRDELLEWKAMYNEDYQDYLTIRDALKMYQRGQGAINRLSPIHQNPDQFDEEVVDAAETLHNDLRQVCEFIEAREEYNDKWLNHMTEIYRDELNSYFEEDSMAHTDQQLQAIFSNDNFNRVNAAAGTGKTTTFGRRIYFILSEYDDVAPTDLLAITFTRNGVHEMQKELEETFEITGVEVSTINSYSKAVAEDQYSDLAFIVGEAKTTEIAAIWRDVISYSQQTYDTFLEAWKNKRYEPNDFEVVEGVFEDLTERSGTTIGGEEVPMDAIPEEGLAHEAIARFLTEQQIEYEYQVHLDWAQSGSDGVVLDFKLIGSPEDETLYIEYCTSEAARNDRPRYRNSNSEHPKTIARIFRSHERRNTDPRDKRGVVLEGEAILDRPSDELNWESQATRKQFKSAVKDALAEKLQATSLALNQPIAGEELKNYVYDRKVLYRDIIEYVEEFISQARVREWTPDQAKKELNEYIKTADEIDKGVPEFCELCLMAYEKFTELFDNETKTDFHGSVVLTRDLLKADKVDDRFLYQYICIDEMQDLNPVQFDVVKHLADQHRSARVFGVGDDWQSIFGFQGARPDLFINFGDVLEAGSYKDLPDPVSIFTDDNPLLSEYTAFSDIQLKKNFRCSDTIVTASNSVIRNNEVRTDKDPEGTLEDGQINVYHLGCDTRRYTRNTSMQQKVEELIHRSPFQFGDIQVLLRQQDGDPEFYYGLKNALPSDINIRTAHNAKGSEAKHIIIPKVSETGGYPSVKADIWLDPIKQPPEVYEEADTSYQLEEERRLFYVALTRAEARVDVLTVQGAESVFIEELPNQFCDHHRPLSDEELDKVENYECRKTVTGYVSGKQLENIATFDWDNEGLIDLNLYDATEDQKSRFDELADADTKVTLQNCGIQYREPLNEDDATYKRLQLQIDKDVIIST